jgi:hypothetical protein
MGDGYFQRQEAFDVVMVKKDVNPMSAKPGDFKRVAVSATEPGVAADDPEVAKVAAEGYVRCEVVASGKPSDHETMARGRATSGDDD